MIDSTPDPIEVAISAIEPRWSEARARGHSRIFQFALLRELHGKIHALKSSCLAQKDFRGLDRADRMERQIQSWALGVAGGIALPSEPQELSLQAPPQNIGDSGGSLRRLCEWPNILPQGLIESIGREALERGETLARQGSLTDRPWELMLALEARREGCEFWTLQGSCSIFEVERTQESLVSSLWPFGILLSTRTLGIRSETQSWEGLWHLALDPRNEPGVTQLRNRIAGRWALLN